MIAAFTPDKPVWGLKNHVYSGSSLWEGQLCALYSAWFTVILPVLDEETHCPGALWNQGGWQASVLSRRLRLAAPSRPATPQKATLLKATTFLEQPPCGDSMMQGLSAWQVWTEVQVGQKTFSRAPHKVGQGFLGPESRFDLPSASYPLPSQMSIPNKYLVPQAMHPLVLF